MRFLIAGLVTIAAFAACGAGSEKKPSSTVSAQQRGVLDTVDALQAASRRGDGEQICTEIFTVQLARSVEAAAKTSCAKEVKEKLFSPQVELALARDIKFRGDRAVATIMERNENVSTLVLVNHAGRWRIDGVKPGPKPSS
jgi:hypothetical protein